MNLRYIVRVDCTVHKKVLCTAESVPDVGGMLSGAKKETSLQDKATDMAVEKAVGTDPLKKAAAKEAVKSAL